MAYNLVGNIHGRRVWAGLSTDTKPTAAADNVNTGDWLYEKNTSTGYTAKYEYSYDAWVKIAEPDSSGGLAVSTVASVASGKMGATLGINAANTPVSASLIGGQSTPVNVGAGLYRIESDVDVFVSDSSTSDINGVTITQNADGFSLADGAVAAGGGDLSSLIGTAMDMAAADFSVEMWLKIDAANTSDESFLVIGDAGDALLNIFFDVQNSAADIRLGVLLEDDSGNNVLEPGATGGDQTKRVTLVGGYDDGLLHCVVGIDRTNEKLTFHLNGTYGELDLAATMSATEFNPSSVTSAGDIVIGGTIAGTSQFGGTVYAIKFYKSLLDDTAVTRRLNGGILNNAYADEYAPSAILTFNQSNPALPVWTDVDGNELGSGNAVMSNEIGSQDLSADTAGITGGTIATTSDSRVIANQPTLVLVTDTYLNVYSQPSDSGTVRLTEQ